jgi:hypothetical protein
MVEEKTDNLNQLFVYEHDAKRLELFIRIVYSFVIALVLIVYVKGYLEYYVHVMSYVYWMADDRPGILPKHVKIYEKK